MSPSHPPKPGSAEYQKHVDEEISHYSGLFREGEGRETLQQPIPPSWQEAERRAAEVIAARTGDFLGGHVTRRLTARPGARMLSLGSGPAGMEIAWAQMVPEARIVCMDLNAGLLDLARQRAAELGLSMEFVTADLNTVELPRGEFDLVYCAASLHHIIELERVAEGIARALRPGGELLTVDIVTANGYLMWPETREIVRSLFRSLPERLRFNHTAYGTPRVDAEIWEADTSQHGMECVRSGDILDVLRGRFEERQFVPYFSLSRRLLDTMYGPNYDLAQPLDRAAFDFVWELDRHYLDAGILRPETFFGLYSPKPPGLLSRLRTAWG